MAGAEPKLELHIAFASFSKVLEKEDLVETAGVEPASKTNVGKRLRV